MFSLRHALTLMTMFVVYTLSTAVPPQETRNTAQFVNRNSALRFTNAEIC